MSVFFFSVGIRNYWANLSSEKCLEIFNLYTQTTNSDFKSVKQCTHLRAHTCTHARARTPPFPTDFMGLYQIYILSSVYISNSFLTVLSDPV